MTIHMLIAILLGMLCIILPIKFSLYTYLIASFFTCIGFVQLGNNWVLVHQFFFVVLCIKFFFTTKAFYKLPPISIFVFYCLISMPLALLSQDAWVRNIDDRLAYVDFSFQQITQFLYLFIGFMVLYIVYSLLRSGRIELDKIYKYIYIMFFVICCLGFIQNSMPKDMFNDLFRTFRGLDQYMQGVYRVTSVFSEASMFGFHLILMLPLVLYKCKKIFSCMITMIVFFISAFLVDSSTLYLGLFVLILGYFILQFSRKKNISVDKIRIYCIVVVIVLCILVIYNEQVINVVKSVINKMSGYGASGSSRLATMQLHFNVFLDNFIFGVGYGTIRSYDLLTTWLPELGMVGMVMYLGYIVYLLAGLYKINTKEADIIFIVISACNVMMMISMNEPYFIIIWIVYAIAEYLVWKEKCRLD